MEFKIENTQVYGLEKAIIASGNPMRVEMDNNDATPTEKDFKRGKLLGTTARGTGDDNYLNGIVVEFDMYAPLFQWKEIQRYHFLDFVSSQSTMHRLTKFDASSQCVSDTDPEILFRYQLLLINYNHYVAEAKTKNMLADKTYRENEKKMWRTLVASLPSGFVLGATMVTNYRQLKTMYYQRRNHRLKEWHEFCDWCLTLPHFKELCLKEEE